MKLNRGKLAILGLIVLLIAAFFIFGLDELLTLEGVQARSAELLAFKEANFGLTALAYAAIYIIVTALSLPGAAVMTLVGGAIFGFTWGLILVSFASTIGATLAFLVSRYLLQDWVEKRFSRSVSKINGGIEKEGAYYLFTLRLVPLFPFFLINLVMGLTRIKTLTFFLISQVGMLPGTAAYVNAGTQLAQIDSVGGILSFPVIASFAILGVLPLFLKRLVNLLTTLRQKKQKENN